MIGAPPTLKNRVIKISVIVLGSGAIVTALGLFLSSMLQQQVAYRDTEQELLRTAPNEVEKLIPSFLLPEQEAGLDILLKRWEMDQSLTAAQVIRLGEAVPVDFRSCILDDKPSTCLSKDKTKVASIIPVKESDQTFGYLLKVKPLESNLRIVEIGKTIFSFLAIAIGVLAFIYMFVIRILSKTLPEALDRLANWLESELADKKGPIDPLPFAELERLRTKIAEVLRRHDRERDQAVIGRLTTGIMHDIRTPLHSLVTAMHMVEDAQEDPRKKSIALEELAMTCRSCVPLIGEIIETTLDSNREIEIRNSNYDLASTVKLAVHQMNSMATKQRAEVIVNAEDSVLFSHDRVQLTRVLLNLIKNAIEAASSLGVKPKILVEVKFIESEKKIFVEVSDNGPGLNVEPNKLFRAFRSSKPHGTGLGLHVSRRIIEAHNGVLSASNRTDCSGATFKVQFPFSVESHQTQNSLEVPVESIS